ncbi:YchJ family metal-binding protein [Microbacterium sp. NPDC076911]|uniref:YchJ family protein n=1 Tax=Microbacterium sp. NPDC076911 TaxID=3154958 RepID=UPI003425B9DE
MSFGPAVSPAGEGFVAVHASALCPCGSRNRFADCCQPLHNGAIASSPERLMRSRYTAFVVGNAQYLAATWHPRTRPEELDLDPQQRWEKLEIIDSGEAGDEGFVAFRATWRIGDEVGRLSERSKFRRAYKRWYYVDGDVEIS